MNLYVLIQEGVEIKKAALFLAKSEGDAREMARQLIDIEHGFSAQARCFAVPLDEAGLVFVGTKR